jgi:hypothetical protein
MEWKEQDIKAYRNRPTRTPETQNIRSGQMRVQRTTQHGCGVHGDPGPGLPARRPAISASSQTQRRCQRRTAARVDRPRDVHRLCRGRVEEGDDVRALPKASMSSTECVDPWLHEVSSSCPIYRHGKKHRLSLSFPLRHLNAFFRTLDLQALETMLSGEESTERRASQTPRFSRYLRFARRRHRHRMQEHDPTDPSPLSLAPVITAPAQEHWARDTMSSA